MPLDRPSQDLLEQGYWYEGWGLTKREHAELQIITALVTNAGRNGLELRNPDEIATTAANIADAWLERGEK